MGAFDITGADRYGPNMRPLAAKYLKLAALRCTSDEPTESRRASKLVDTVDCEVARVSLAGETTSGCAGSWDGSPSFHPGGIRSISVKNRSTASGSGETIFTWLIRSTRLLYVAFSSFRLWPSR
jgi:hypothetical protein